MKIEINNSWKTKDGTIIDFNNGPFKEQLKSEEKIEIFFFNTLYLEEIFLKLPIKIKVTPFNVFDTKKKNIYLEYNICEYKFYQTVDLESLNAKVLNDCIENQFHAYTFSEFLSTLSSATRYKDERRDKYLQKLKEDIIYYGNES